ncbi:hypothetical protein EMIT0111MI5_60180 [Burkholderia sp. IT-111MI5]
MKGNTLTLRASLSDGNESGIFTVSLRLRSDPSHTGSKKHEFDDKTRFQGTRGLVSDCGGQRR